MVRIRKKIKVTTVKRMGIESIILRTANWIIDSLLSPSKPFTGALAEGSDFSSPDFRQPRPR
jgi:hypothetical protein